MLYKHMFFRVREEKISDVHTNDWRIRKEISSRTKPFPAKAVFVTASHQVNDPKVDYSENLGGGKGRARVEAQTLLDCADHRPT